MEKININNLYFGFYNDSEMDIFNKEIDLSFAKVYKSLDGKIGINIIEESDVTIDDYDEEEGKLQRFYWYQEGEILGLNNSVFKANINLYSIVSINEILYLMASHNLIDDYEYGYASEEQINKAKDFAYDGKVYEHISYTLN